MGIIQEEHLTAATCREEPLQFMLNYCVGHINAEYLEPAISVVDLEDGDLAVTVTPYPPELLAGYDGLYAVANTPGHGALDVGQAGRLCKRVGMDFVVFTGQVMPEAYAGDQYIAKRGFMVRRVKPEHREEVLGQCTKHLRELANMLPHFLTDHSSWLDSPFIESIRAEYFGKDADPSP